MKTLALLAALAATIFVADPATAQLIIYKGTLKETATEQGLSRQFTDKYYLIVDYNTASMVEIYYRAVNGTKYFGTSTRTNYHFVEISAPKGKTIGAIAHSPNSCDVSEGFTADGVFLQGTESMLTVNTALTISFPKMLSGGGDGVSYSDGPPRYYHSSLVLSFDSAQTLASNGNKETLDLAQARLINLLESQGNNQASEKSQLRAAP